MYRYNTTNNSQGGCGNNCRQSNCKCSSCRPATCRPATCRPATCRPVTCRPCCAPTCCICCCRRPPASTTFSVTYLSNGGTGGLVDGNIAPGTQYTIKSNGEVNVTRPGYTFTGWNTAADGSGTAYAAGSATTINSNLVLYAQWTPDTPITFDVSYLPNGGTGQHSDTGIAAGSQYTVKTQAETGITNAGNTFTGWNTAANGGGTAYQPGDNITVNSDVTLYAQWTPTINFTVSYEANGGTGQYSDDNIAPGTQYTVKTDGATGITRTGYNFTGWNTAANGGGTAYQPGATFTVNSDETLYAQWEPITFDVSYNANGGTGAYNDPDIASGTQYTVKTQGETGITRTGFNFTGWNTDAGGSGTAYAPGSQTTITGDLALYAQWEPITFDVDYNANGGTGQHSDNDLADGSQYTVKTQAETGITRANYNFTGWNTEAGGGGTAYTAGSQITITEDLTLYAQWTPITQFSVNYEANGGTGQHSDNNIDDGTQYTVETDTNTGISRTGYTFTGWNTEAGGGGTDYMSGSQTIITGNLTLYAQWSIIELFTVNYEANGGTGQYSDGNISGGTQYTVKTRAATGIIRNGYTFTGWNTAANGSGTAYQPGAVIAINNNVTLYAQWKRAGCDINYNSNGGKGHYSDEDVAVGTQYTVKTQAATGITRTGYTFTGWNTAADGKGTAYAAGSKFNVTTDLTLYAQWKA